MDITPYKQTTYQTCLAVSLLHLAGIKPTRSKEVAIWKSGWVFNFLTGQVNYLSDLYKVPLEVAIHYKLYYKSTVPIWSKGVYARHVPVTTSLLCKKLERGPVIAYVDAKYLGCSVHEPHFVVVLRREGKSVVVLNSHYDQVQIVSIKCMAEAMISLRDNLHYSPVLVSRAAA